MVSLECGQRLHAGNRTLRTYAMHSMRLLPSVMWHYWYFVLANQTKLKIKDKILDTYLDAKILGTVK